MNSSVRINVRATFGDAAKQFGTMIAELDKLDAAARRTNTGLGVMDTGLARSTASLEVWGKKLQYNGSILTRNFTLPLGLAFGALLKQEMDYQRSFASLEQVYKRAGASVSDYRQNLINTQHDLAALDGIVVTLSSHFGVQRTEVATMATELGRAGSAGVSLAKDTESALIAQRAYNLTATDAVGVITTLRASYHLTSDEARNTLGIMAVSNESTRGSFDLLAQGLIRAAPVATQLGVPVRNLVALLSTLNQAGFKGGESGNALSAGLQRLVVVTPKASDVLKRLGIDANGVAFQSLNGAQRIQMLADKLQGANGDLKAYAASVIFGVQRSKQFDAAISDLTSKHGVYNQILKDTADQSKTNGFLAEQLGIKLKNPAVAFDVLKVTAENNARVIGQRLLPVLSGLMTLVVGLTGAFAKLKPPQQEFVIFALVVLALIGPIMRVVGAFALLADYAKRAALIVFKAFGGITSEMAADAAAQVGIAQAAAEKEVTIAEAKFAAIRSEQAVANAEYLAQLSAMNAAVAAGNATQAALLEANLATTTAKMTALVTEAEIAQAAAVTAGEGAIAAGSVAAEAAFPPLLGITVILAVIAGAAYLFRDSFLRAFEQIAEALGYIVAEIYALLQWLNPFARHSPSLVENTENGTRVMSGHWANMARSSSASMDIVKRAIRDLNAALANGPNPGVNFNVTKGFRAVEKQGNKQDISAYKEGMDALRELGREEKTARAAMDAQTIAVKKAKDAYDDAGVAIKNAEGHLKDLEAQQKEMEAAVKKLGDPAALRSQATAASNMGRALLAAGNPELAAQFGAQADKLNAQADKAQKAKDSLGKLSKEIDSQKDAIDKLRDARDKLLATYDAEKEKLDAIKSNYADLKSQITEITDALRQLAQAAAAANAAATAAGRHHGGGKDKNPGFGGAAGSSLPGFDAGPLKNQGGDLEKYLRDLKGRLGQSIGTMFPNPTKGITDFFGHLKRSFKKGMDDFTQGKFEQAFGFGKGWGQSLQAGLTVGILGVGLIVAGLGLKIIGWMLRGGPIVAAFNFGKGLFSEVLRGGEEVKLAEKLGFAARSAIGLFLTPFRTAAGLVGRALIAVGTSIVEAAPGILTAVSEAMLGIGEGILAAVGAVPLAIAAVLVALVAALYLWHDPIWNFAKQIPGWIMDGLTTAWNAAVDLLTFIGTWLDKNVTAGAKKFGEWAQKIPGWIMDGIKFAWEKGFYLLGFLAGWLVGKAIQFTKIMADFGANLPGWIWGGVVKAWDGAMKLGEKIGDWVGDKARDSVKAFGHLVGWGKKLPGHVWSGLHTAWDDAMKLGERVGTWVSDKGRDAVKGAEHLGTFGKKLPGHIWSGLVKAWDGAMTLADKIKSWLRDIPGKVADALSSLGAALVHGIAAGVTGAASALLDAGKNLVSGFLDGVKKAAGISSPSKLFAAQVGVPIAQGIAHGITSQTRDTSNAAIAHVHSVMDAVERTAMQRSAAITLPTLHQQVAMSYSGASPEGGMVNTRAAGGTGAPGANGGMTQHINVNMADSPTTADPHQIAASLAWKMRTAGAY